MSHELLRPSARFRGRAGHLASTLTWLVARTCANRARGIGRQETEQPTVGTPLVPAAAGPGAAARVGEQQSLRTSSYPARRCNVAAAGWR